MRQKESALSLYKASIIKGKEACLNFEPGNVKRPSVFAVYIVVLCVLFFVALPVRAADNAVAVNPIDQWRVSLDVDGMNDDALCTLSRTYFKGFQLHVAINEDKEVQLLTRVPSRFKLYGALQNAMLIEQDSYAIDLDYVSAEEDAVYMSVDNKLSYFDAIRESGFLKFPYERVTYTVSLETLGDALETLEGCYISETGDQAAVRRQLSEEVRGAYQEEPALLEGLIKQGGGEGSLAYIARSANISGETGKEVAATDRLIQSLTQKLSLLEKEKESLRVKLAKVENDQLSKIKKSVEESKETYQYEKRIQYLTKKIAALEKRDKLYKRLGELGAIKPAEEKQDEFVLPDTDPGAYRFMTSRITALAHKNIVMNKRLENMQSRLNDESDLQNAQGEIVRLQDEIDLIKEENEILKERRRVFDMIASDAIADPFVASGNIVALANEKNKLYSHIEELHSAYSERNELVRMSDSIESLLNQVNRLQTENKRLEREKEESVRAMEDDFAQIDPSVPAPRITPSVYEKMNLYSDLGEQPLLQDYSKLMQEDRIESSLKSGEIRAELEKEYRAAMDMLREEKEKLAAQVQNLSQKNNQLESQIEDATGRIVTETEETASKFGLSEHDTLLAISEMKGKISTLVSENDVLKDELEGVEKTLNAKEELVSEKEQTVRQTEMAKDALQQQIVTLQQMLKQKEGAIGALQESLEQKQDVLEEKMLQENADKEALAREKAEYAKMRNSLDRLRAENTQLSEIVASYRGAQEIRGEEIARAKMEVDRLKNDMSTLKTQNDKLTAQKQAIQTFETSDEYAAMQRRMAALNKKSSAVSDRIAALKQKVQGDGFFDIVDDNPTAPDLAKEKAEAEAATGASTETSSGAGDARDQVVEPLKEGDKVMMRSGAKGGAVDRSVKEDISGGDTAVDAPVPPVLPVDEDVRERISLLSQENEELRSQINRKNKQASCAKPGSLYAGKMKVLDTNFAVVEMERAMLREKGTLTDEKLLSSLQKENKILRKMLSETPECLQSQSLDAQEKEFLIKDQ